MFRCRIAIIGLGFCLSACASSPGPEPAPGSGPGSGPGSAPTAALTSTPAPDVQLSAEVKREPTPEAPPAPVVETEPVAEVPALPPPAPDGVDKELWSILANLCPIAIHRESQWENGAWKIIPGGQVSFGCRSWPPAWKGPDGRAPVSYGHYSFPQWQEADLGSIPYLPFVTHYDGSFTRAGAQQKVLYIENCRVMDGMTITGCAVVVEKREGKWVVDAFHREAGFTNCVTSRRLDGRDLLVCHDGMGALYQAIVNSLFYVDFTQPDGNDHGDVDVPSPPGMRRTRIAALAHNGFEIRCGDVPAPGSSEEDSGHWTGGFLQMSIGKLASRDVNGDGRADVILELERNDVPYTPEMSSRVRTLCRDIRAKDPDGRGELGIEKLVSKPARFQLQFLNDGRKLVPASGTRRVLKNWGGAPRYTW